MDPVETPVENDTQAVLQRLRERSPFTLTLPLTTLLDILYTPGDDGARAYHNFHHLDEMSACYSQVAKDIGWAHPEEVFAALLLHDAVYFPCNGDNEERSAELARQVLPSLLSPRNTLDIEAVASLILLTATHGHVKAEGLSQDTKLFLDCDMSILGADPLRFADYGRAIAREYARAVSPELYAAGRRAFLHGLLAPGHRIYHSDYFFERLENQARENIRKFLSQA